MMDQQTEEQNAPYLSETSKKTSSFSTLISVFALLLIILVALFTGALWQQQRIMNQKIQQLDGLTVSTSQASSNYKNQFAAINAALAQQGQSTKQNTFVLNNLISNLSSGRDVWLVSDATHLIEWANVTLNVEYNVNAAITLLNIADQRLSATGNPKLFAVRNLIAHDIVKLQSLPPVDVVGTYLRLQALREQTLQLPLADSQFKSTSIDNLLVQPAVSHGSWWEKTWRNGVNALGQVIVIRHRELPINPLISPQQHVLLLQSVYLLYSQAQWAALHRQQAIYQSSLTQIMSLIKNYFSPDQNSQQLIQQLQALSSQNIAPAFPDISDSLDALNAYSKTLRQINLTTPTSPQSLHPINKKVKEV